MCNGKCEVSELGKGTRKQPNDQSSREPPATKAIHYRQIDYEPCPNQQNVNGAKDSNGIDHRLRPITTDSPRDEGLKLRREE